jgi:RHS repeat-associated protein
VVVLVASGLSPAVAVSARSGLEQVDWWSDLATAEGPVDVAPTDEPGQDPPPRVQNTPAEVPKPMVPTPQESELTLGGRGDEAVADGMPVAVTPGTDSVKGSELEVALVDDSALGESAPVLPGAPVAIELGGSGSDALSDSLALGAGEAAPLEVSIDYADFEHAYGAGFIDRAQVVALPSCVVKAADGSACDAAWAPLPVRNDAEESQLVVTIDDLAGLEAQVAQAVEGPSAPDVPVAPLVDDPGPAPQPDPDVPSSGTAEEAASPPEGATADAVVERGAVAGAAEEVGTAGAGSGVLLVLTAGASGELGNYGATPLGASSSWQVGLGTGEFNWSYDIGAPAPPAGAAPQVSVNYSSGSVDGMVASRNTQGSQVGIGFGDFAGGFIERRYERCAEAEPVVLNVDDLCFDRENATISLNGVSSELVPLDTTYTKWHLKNETGWLVEKPASGRPSGNGDNDNEFWKVTTSDGTQYWFGWGSRPDGFATDSVFGVPVFADDNNDPCWAGQAAQCTQAWRWNLDKVVDPNGNTTTFTYLREVNKYRALRGWGATDLTYTRSGRLGRIEYGARNSSPFQPAARVVFEAQYRCGFLVAACPEPGPDPDPDEPAFPDVPNDLMCTSNCAVWSPTFFSTKRYSRVYSEVVADGTWRQRDQVEFGNSFLDHEDDNDYKLYLTGLQRTGLSGGSLPLPEVNLWHGELQNRVDVNTADGRLPMWFYRPMMIRDEYGRETWVTYDQQSPCAAPHDNWDQNHEDCFPQKVNGRWGVFNKYITTKVEERDQTGGSPTMVTTYDYHGDPAWHHAQDDFVSTADQTWSDWRGYGTVTVNQGTSRTRHRIFRGMHNDLLPGGGHRSVDIEPPDGMGFDSFPAQPDYEWFAGLPLAEASLGSLGEAQRSVLHEYTAQQTTLAGGPEDRATWVGETRTTTNTAVALNLFESQRTTTTYNGHYQPATILEEGWLSANNDQRCTKMTYATNTTGGVLMTSYPATSVLVAGDCASTDERARSETYYDGATTVGAPPTTGNVTKERTKIGASTWITTSESTYDTFGRPLTVRDGNSHTTRFDYQFAPGGGFPLVTTETRVTNEATQAGHIVKTTWRPEYGVPVEVTKPYFTGADPGNNKTTYGYDPLGQLTAVRSPTEQPATSGLPRTQEFAYIVSSDKSVAPIVKAKQLVSATGPQYAEGWVVYDSFLRERQTQAYSPVAGNAIVTETVYDDRGLVKEQWAPAAVALSSGQQPGQGLLDVPVAGSNHTVTSYDRLQRPNTVTWYRGTAAAWDTDTTYTHDTATVTPSVGGPTRTVVDGLGRTIRREEQDNAGAWQATRFSYDLADNLTSITDANNNETTYSYDMAGRRIGQDDADAGVWTYAYDAVGNQTRVTDARTTSTFTNYDTLDRPIDRRRDSATGPVLASWAYDTKGLGLLSSATSVTPQGSWVVEPVGYDGRDRPMGQKVTVPSGATGLAGSYTVGYEYDRADNLTKVSYPAVGGLPAEDVVTTYSSAGYPATMSGAANYVGLAAYDGIGRPSLFGFGATGGTYSAARAWAFNTDQRLASVTTAAAGGSQAARQDLAYDDVGNIVDRKTTLGSQSFRECFTYDARNQLTKAITRTATTTCASGTGAASGSLAYERNYTYGTDGNMLTRNNGGANTSYAYTDAAHPHAPKTVGTSTYNWDANGYLASRTVSGQTDTLTWNAERRLESVTGTTGTSRYAYDPDGQRLYQELPNGTRTIYIPGHEITRTGSTTVATRTYTFNDELIATRTPSSLHYTDTDHQNSLQASITAGASTPDQTQAYDPYGNKRGTGTFDTKRGWIGEIGDTTTNLAYLNARYYDPTLGRFISPDPIIDTTNPISINPYTYGVNNPTTYADPSGEWIPISTHGRSGYHAKWSPSTNKRNIWTAKRVARRTYERRVTSASRRLVTFAPRVSEVAQALFDISAMQFTNAEAYIGLAGVAALMRMRGDNPDPRFWAALKEAGSALALSTLAARPPQIPINVPHPIDPGPVINVPHPWGGMTLVTPVPEDGPLQPVITSIQPDWIQRIGEVVHADSGKGKVNPDDIRGKAPEDVPDHLPPGWVKGGSARGGGTIYHDPERRGRQVRVMPGYPPGSRPDPVTWGPYAVVSNGDGPRIKVPLAGNPTL